MSKRLPTHVPLQSSNLASVAYDRDTRTLEVEFKNGGVYRYHDVADHHYDRLLAATSAGAYFHQHIRAQHQVSKIDTSTEASDA